MLLAAVIAFMAWQHYRYRKIKKLYRADYARASCLKSIGRLLPLMPQYKSRRYIRAERLITDSGLGITVEGFYLAKTLLFIIGFVFFVSIQTTNTFLLYDNIINDTNNDKSIIDKAPTAKGAAQVSERELFEFAESLLPKGKSALKELNNRENSGMYIEYLSEQLESRWPELGKAAEDAAERMYQKLVRIRSLETDYLKYLTALAVSIFLYFLPEAAAFIKLLLIEDKRDWEVLNYMYVFSIFGRMPPYSLRNVLSNILLVSEVYKPLINEAYNGIRSGKGEEAIGSLLKRVENQELYELLESMRLSLNTGLLNIMDSIDEMAANQLKWQEIKSIRRRKSKQVIAMVPVVLIMLLGMVYFSYSLSTLSNPMNFIK